MEAGEFQDEECLVALAIGFAFKCLNLVVNSFKFSGGNRVVKEVENACGMRAQRLSQGDHLDDAAFHRSLAPGVEMSAHSGKGRLAPERAQVFLEVISRRERLIETQGLLLGPHFILRDISIPARSK